MRGNKGCGIPTYPDGNIYLMYRITKDDTIEELRAIARRYNYVYLENGEKIAAGTLTPNLEKVKKDLQEKIEYKEKWAHRKESCPLRIFSIRECEIWRLRQSGESAFKVAKKFDITIKRVNEIVNKTSRKINSAHRPNESPLSTKETLNLGLEPKGFLEENLTKENLIELKFRTKSFFEKQPEIPNVQKFTIFIASKNG